MLILATLASVAAPAAADELVLSAFSSDSVTRHDAATGALVGSYGPAPLSGVLGATVGPDALVYVCSETNDRVLRFRGDTGELVDEFIVDDAGTAEDETGGLDGPSGIAFGPDGAAYVASFNTDAILRYDGRTGAFLSVFVAPGAGGLNGPDAGIAFGPNGNLYVPSFWNNRVKEYDGTTGAFVANVLGPTDGLAQPRQVLFPGDGFFYVSSEGNDRVLRCALDGSGCVFLVRDDPGTTPDESGGLDGPTGIDFGPDGRLYVASIGTDSVLRYDSAGRFAGEFVPSGAAGIDAPTFLFFRPDVDPYCIGAPNSVGAGARINASGFTSLAANDLTLEVSYGPPGQTGLFFHGPGTLSLPFGDGFLCVAGPQYRLPVSALDSAGRASSQLDLNAPSSVISAGSTWYFQYWYRDPAAGGAGHNTSNGLRTTFGS